MFRTEYQLWFAGSLDSDLNQKSNDRNGGATATAETLVELVAKAATIAERIGRDNSRTWLVDPNAFTILRVEYHTREQELSRSIVT